MTRTMSPELKSAKKTYRNYSRERLFKAIAYWTEAHRRQCEHTANNARALFEVQKQVRELASSGKQAYDRNKLLEQQLQEVQAALTTALHDNMTTSAKLTDAIAEADETGTQLRRAMEASDRERAIHAELLARARTEITRWRSAWEMQTAAATAVRECVRGFIEEAARRNA